MHTVLEAADLRADKKDLPPKKRVWGFRAPARHRIRKSASQVAESRRKNQPTPTTNALGRWFYLQPDPAGPVARFVARTQGARASICDSVGGQGFPENESDGALEGSSQTLEFSADASAGGAPYLLGAELMLDVTDLNTFGYALQNPLTYVDPTGENPAAVRAAQAAATALRMARAGAVAAWGLCKSIQCKVKIHPDHHYFGPPFNRKMRHVQATCWRRGIKGSTINIRIPIP